MNSIEKCGFTGDILLITYGDDPNVKAVLDYISDKPNYKSFPGILTKSVVCDRFRDTHWFLENNNYDYVFATDPSDVVFQTNPSLFVRSKLKDKSILCGSESVIYKNETWGNENMMQSFPMYYEKMKEKVIYNAGTISGKCSVISNLFLDIFRLCIQTNVINPDQAAFNVLIQSKYHDSCYFSGIEDGYAVQCGTTNRPDRVMEYGHLLLEKPILKDGIAYNSKMEKTCLLHQYNKVPGFYEEVLKKYE
jgi:hypothetical protein